MFFAPLRLLSVTEKKIPFFLVFNKEVWKLPYLVFNRFPLIYNFFVISLEPSELTSCFDL